MMNAPFVMASMVSRKPAKTRTILPRIFGTVSTKNGCEIQHCSIWCGEIGKFYQDNLSNYCSILIDDGNYVILMRFIKSSS